MKFLRTSVDILTPEGYDLKSLFKHAERCGRTCYKSEDKITETSASAFVQSLINSGHFSVLEHIPAYLYVSSESNLDRSSYEKMVVVSTLQQNPYSRIVKTYHNGLPRNFITTNYRVLLENDLLGKGLYSALPYMVAPLSEHVLRVTVRFTTDIGVTREFNRHRVHSPSEQSTRFCNYSKSKFGSEISVLWHPDMGFGEQKSLEYYMSSFDDRDSWSVFDWYMFSALVSEEAYMRLIGLGRKPQEARRVLNLDTASELVHTAFLDDWYVFLDKRFFGSTGKPHPDAIECSRLLFRKFYDAGLLDEDYLQHCREDFNFVFDSHD